MAFSIFTNANKIKTITILIIINDQNIWVYSHTLKEKQKDASKWDKLDYYMQSIQVLKKKYSLYICYSFSLIYSQVKIIFNISSNSNVLHWDINLKYIKWIARKTWLVWNEWCLTQQFPNYVSWRMFCESQNNQGFPQKYIFGFICLKKYNKYNILQPQ